MTIQRTLHGSETVSWTLTPPVPSVVSKCDPLHGTLDLVPQRSSSVLPNPRDPTSCITLPPIAPTVLPKKIAGLRVCTIVAGPERGMRREHAPSERIETLQRRR
ncbi:hypothetical protein Y032_0034g2954 [Ancylostoma ceylanicum]|uniref:Uncharacterized protein n=1 Tax=Ancylostoma ceylanicum TaxID=53326 RepID=A0A016UNB8_9BILA|nr:hypothetical protein Y032_0034g2954 [Ancylostoma ceylanicum]